MPDLPEDVPDALGHEAAHLHTLAGPAAPALSARAHRPAGGRQRGGGAPRLRPALCTGENVGEHGMYRRKGAGTVTKSL